jgi:hypothetical protein
VSDYLDVETGAVAQSGRNTEATAGDWSAWASQAETLLRGVAGSAAESTVTGAVESYLSTWNPLFKNAALQAEALGANATSAANVVSNADASSAAALNQQASVVSTSSTHLSRPITSGD